MIIQNGGCIHVPPKMGGTHARPKAAQKRGPPSACFWNLPLLDKLWYYFYFLFFLAFIYQSPRDFIV